MLAKASAKRELVQFPGGRVRQCLECDHVVRHPLLWNTIPIAREDADLVERLAFLEGDDQDRPLAPYRMTGRDNGGFQHIRMRDGNVLERDRADPFSAGFDQVLRPVDDLHEPVGVDGGDISSEEPTIRVDGIGVRGPIVTAGEPRAPHQEVAEGFSIPGQLVPIGIDDLHVDTIGAAARCVSRPRLPGETLMATVWPEIGVRLDNLG